MKHISKYTVKMKVLAIRVLLGAFVVALFFLPNFRFFEHDENNSFTVYMYGEAVGVISEEDHVDELIARARKSMASRASSLVMLDPMNLRVEGEEKLFRVTDPDKEIVQNMIAVMENHHRKARRTAYSMKVRGLTVNMASSEDVHELLTRTIAKYDTEGLYEVVMEKDENRDLNVLTATIRLKKEEELFYPYSGAGYAIYQTEKACEDSYLLDFDEYALGLQSIGLSETIEVVEASVSAEELLSVEEAMALLTQEQAVQQTYEVQPGDTLSGISLKLDIPMETIVQMNSEFMENVNSTIHVGQTLVITVPEPELAVEWVNREHYNETYEAEIEYVYNDDWFTTQKQVLQEPQAGYRELIADVHYSNDTEVERDIIKQDVLMEAVPKIVEVGTKIPPTFIWPLSGGRISSYFGRRKSPTAGASSYHKGLDIATPTGSAVYASSGGVVTSAGWSGGYGYAVVIRHPDGHSTRYGHLSRILVSVGQTVAQGQTIAKSGSTGVSTGPHLHFEVIENGVQVDPLRFLR